MKKRILGILLSFALMLTMMPGMSLTALAWEGDPYASLVNTTTVVKFDGKEWYLIENNSTAANAGTVTLLSKECVGKSAYNSSGSFVTYDNNPTIKEAVDTWYSSNITADAKTAVADNKAFILESLNGINSDVLKCKKVAGTDYNVWWLCSRSSDNRAMGVDGDDGYLYDGPVTWEYGVRPALKLDLSKVVFDSSSSSKTFSILKSYPLWVGGTRVTSANASDIPAKAGDARTGKASYTPASGNIPAKLTLNNYTYEGKGYNNAAIFANENLTIESKGKNTITQTGSTCSYGIFVSGSNSLTITGSGSLTSNAGTATGDEYGEYSEGISVGNQLIIEKDTTVTATGGNCTTQNSESHGVRASDGLTVNGSLTASGSSEVSNSYGVSTYGTMDVGETGTVDATGRYGITSNGDVIINGDVTAAGSEQAIYGTVKNSIAGTGWDNTEGTGTEHAIKVNTDSGKTLDYKKVQFVSMFTVTFVDGQGNTLSTEQVVRGTAATAPADPTRDGYTFKGWDKDFSKVTEDMTVTALWEKKADPAPAASVTVNSKTISAKTLNAAVAKAGVSADSVSTIVIGKKVKKIKKGSFQNLRNADTLVVKSKKLTKARVKGSLKGSSITKVKVNVGKKKTNKYYAKRYKKIFTKKNCGKKVSVSR